MRDQAHVKYMTERIMPNNRKRGCKCEYTPESYANRTFSHKSDCPSPGVECLPNAGKLMEALRIA